MIVAMVNHFHGRFAPFATKMVLRRSTLKRANSVIWQRSEARPYSITSSARASSAGGT